MFSGNLCRYTFAELFCRYDFAKIFRRHYRTTHELKLYSGNLGVYLSRWPCENGVTCARFRLLKNNVNKGIYVYCAPLSSERPARSIKLQHDPDKFGDLSRESSADHVYDEDEIKEEKFITYPVPANQKLRISEYAKIIKEHLSRKDITAALDVLEKRMIMEDRVKPDGYIYSLLISACARFGHSRKAFKLYNRMKKRGLKIHGSVYTALFNACANNPYPEEGLKQATGLQVKLAEKGVELNASHYHAMMKAYGRCGDLPKAFQVADLMTDKQIPINEESFNFLLQACISDTQAGFRHALLVWHKMLKRRVKPTIYSFNLILRAVRDCNMGEFQEVEKCIQELTSGYTPADHAFKLPSRSAIENELETVPSTGSRENQTSLWSLPDLLSPVPRLNCDISQLDLSKPHERLLLLGGGIGFLQQMANFLVKPTIITYTVLLDCIPPTISAEKSLISRLKKDGIQPDIDFYNMLIKKRSFRSDYSSAQDVLTFIKEEKLIPDIVTFGVLSLSCTNEEEANLLIRNMRQAGYRINVEILGGMLRQACLKHNFKYITKILYIAKEEMIEPSPKFLEMLQRLIASSREILNKMRADNAEVPESLRKRPFKKEFVIFLYKYQAWLKEMDDMKNSRLREKTQK